MDVDITVTVGGAAGQGIQTVGELLAAAVKQAGLYCYGINDFESRIRGGHSFFQLRVSSRQVCAPRQRVQLLVALNRATIEQHREQLAADARVILNSEESTDNDAFITVPFDKLAAQAGDRITANSVAAGAVLGILGIAPELLDRVLSDRFSEKTEALKSNRDAAALGYAAVEKTDFSYRLKSRNCEPTAGALMNGAQVLALGALAGDCRFAAFYPMSPATGIMIYLASLQNRFPLMVEQAEDEIAAVNMIIGASHAGVRSVTATSGGGFCLMTEALGLAGISETPIVIINAQRPGPATGLPTRTAQGDLLFTIHAAQDDFPRFVFAPGSFEEGYECISRALTLSEQYQVPAIILVDQLFNDSLGIVEERFAVADRIERYLETDPEAESGYDYRRYENSISGISSRRLPCRGQSLVRVSGDEHSPDGHMSESAEGRVEMVDKRARKSDSMIDEVRTPCTRNPSAPLVLVGWGSTKGVLQEACTLLNAEGIDSGHVHFIDIWPFPALKAEALLGRGQQIICVEQNSTGQFARLLRQETGIPVDGHVLKYDGRPFFTDEIIMQVKQLIG